MGGPHSEGLVGCPYIFFPLDERGCTGMCSEQLAGVGGVGWGVNGTIKNQGGSHFDKMMERNCDFLGRMEREHLFMEQKMLVKVSPVSCMSGRH